MTRIPTIKFSEEWEKLKPKNRIPGIEFSTMRGYDPRKETYYIDNLKTIFNVYLKGKIIGKAHLIKLYVSRPSDHTFDFLRKDTHLHYSMRDIEQLFKRMYNHEDPVCVTLFYRWVEVVE